MQSRGEEMKAAWKIGGVEGCRRLLERKRHEWKSIPLNVAVIGNSGVGKSSFINAIRGLTADDEGAAHTDVIEATMEIRGYRYPDNPMLMLWDIPGVGTNVYHRQTYLFDIGVDRFDFFLLITADRFTENDTWLGNEFHKRNKTYYFVRTKIGNDISDHKKAHPRTHDEEAVKGRIRRHIAGYLRKISHGDVHIFLIDNFKCQKFDFEELKKKIMKDFPELKRTALIRALHFTSEEMIQLKVAELRFRMWMSAALSGVAGAVPNPGASLAIDCTIIAHEAKSYFEQLGLDSESNILPIIIDCLPFLAAMTPEEGVKYYFQTGVIGPFIGIPSSVWLTKSALNLILGKFEKLAIEVMVRAADRLERR